MYYSHWLLNISTVLHASLMPLLVPQRCIQISIPYPTQSNPLIAFDPVYIHKSILCWCWVVTTSWSIKNFAFWKYLCRTLGNCCRLYGKHWEMSAMINSTKNCLKTQLWFNQNIRSSIQKVSMTAPSRGNFWYLQWIITSSGACLAQHLGHIVNNGQQSAVLHASVMPFLQILFS